MQRPCIIIFQIAMSSNQDQQIQDLLAQLEQAKAETFAQGGAKPVRAHEQIAAQAQMLAPSPAHAHARLNAVRQDREAERLAIGAQVHARRAAGLEKGPLEIRSLIHISEATRPY